MSLGVLPCVPRIEAVAPGLIALSRGLASIPLNNLEVMSSEGVLEGLFREGMRVLYIEDFSAVRFLPSGYSDLVGIDISPEVNNIRLTENPFDLLQDDVIIRHVIEQI